LYWLDERDFLDKRKPKGCIDLRGCSLATGEQHTKRLNTFGIFHTHRRDYFLEAKNKIDLMSWVSNIENILGVREEGVSMQDFELMTVVGRGSYGKVSHMVCPILVCYLRTLVTIVVISGGGVQKAGYGKDRESRFSPQPHNCLSSFIPLPCF
jgi:hypothetical protein